MRPSPETPQNISPPPSSCDPRTHSCKWWPYSNSNDFGANTAMILILLLCALICALALNTAIRWVLRGRLPQTLGEVQEEQKQNPDAEAAGPTMVYSAGMKLGGGDQAECAICLSEFVEGEGIRVLGSCNHGFHVYCIQQWLRSRSSCPTCRRSCLASSPQTIDNSCCHENGLNRTTC